MRKKGIDTIGIKVKIFDIFGNQKDEIVGDLNDLSYIMDKKYKPLKNGYDYFGLKPSMEYSGGVELSTMNEARDIITSFKKNTTEMYFTRVDFATDRLTRLEEDYTLYKTIAELLTLKRGSKTFQTLVDDKIGNIKSTDNGRRESTFYNCEDKNRFSNLRFEQRFFDLRNEKSFTQSTKDCVNNYIKEIHKLEELLPLLEKRQINKAISKIDKLKRSGTDKMKIDYYFDKVEDLILTRNTAKGIFEYYSNNKFKDWFTKYKAKRPHLKYTTKIQLKTFFSDEKRLYKEMLKGE